MKTALITIATGEKYHKYGVEMLASADEFFPPHDVFAFSDDPFFGGYLADYKILIPAKGYPRETLMRYRTILGEVRSLEQYQQIFYVDADMLFVAPVGEEIFSQGITATLHPGYVGQRGTPDTNIKSYAYCTHNTAYYCGGFNGGDGPSYLGMAQELAEDIDIDDRRGVMAIWHDESHLNRYLAAHPPAKVLGPEYCYPEDANEYYKSKWRAAGLGEVEPKLVALTKRAGR